MNKNLVIVLTMLPHHGGKYQYVLSVLNSFIGQSNFKVTVIFFDNHWNDIVPNEFQKIKSIAKKKASDYQNKIIHNR